MEINFAFYYVANNVNPGVLFMVVLNYGNGKWQCIANLLFFSVLNEIEVY